ncbi:hypothetical protein BV97_01230 [Novosphingobium resinovorum]|uniref:Transposase n=1 Tax=Novosphingobium resinovorum TaxID=158500 RepID=A0A031K3E4_9SPHN|nr:MULTISPECIES: DUF2274 domain-containing protein [Novosphingobium]EZP83127.1 hypothetical protein BV97_01230 [Novosphingobium resinovorum]
MGNLKLPKLPERTLVKCTIQLTPNLEKSLQDYAAAYEAEYGQIEAVADLIPHMLAAFLESDRGFARARKA